MASLLQRSCHILRASATNNIKYATTASRNHLNQQLTKPSTILPQQCSISRAFHALSLNSKPTPAITTTRQFTSLIPRSVLQQTTAPTQQMAMIPSRSLVIQSRNKGIRKSVKSVRKRFIPVTCPVTHLETFKRLRSCKTHKMVKKSSRRKWRLRGMVLLRNKTQIKKIKAMYGPVY